MTDPRWENERIVRRRTEAAAVAGRYDEEDHAKMLAHFESELRSIGVSKITEDLLLLLWGGLSVSLDFIATDITATCINPRCGYASFQHACGGIDLEGVILLDLERKAGQTL